MTYKNSKGFNHGEAGEMWRVYSFISQPYNGSLVISSLTKKKKQLI